MRRAAILACIGALMLAGTAQAAPAIQEFNLPTAAAQPQDIVQGPDGNMWFAERGVNKIGRISGTNPGAIQEFDIAAGGMAPDIIVVGPDGALWYTEQGSSSVGRMPPGNPAGVTRFAGMGIIQPRGIAVGPDGNLWVADADAATPDVHRISPAGAAVGAPIALPVGTNPRGIALGPDGDMWVGDFNTPRVIRITTGVVPAVDPLAGFPVPAGTPIDVIGGADGNIWYAGQGTTVGKVTPTGTATAYVSKGVDPFGLTLGPDGAVWFAEFQGNAVGRVGTNGVTSHVTGMTAGAGPRYVAKGPNNTVWFTEETGNRVGRVTGIEVGGGGGGGPGGGGTDKVKPAVTRLKLSAKRFRLGGKGITIRYTLSEAARVTLSFERVTSGRKVGGRCVKRTRRNRSRRRCTRYAAVTPVLSLADQPAGPRTIAFKGRLSRRKRLSPGVYRLTLQARDTAGNRSKRLSARVAVLAPKRKPAPRS